MNIIIRSSGAPRKKANDPAGLRNHVENHCFRGSAYFACDKTVINQRRIEKSAFEDQSEENSV